MTDARSAWLRFGLTMGGAIVGGFGLGCLIAAVIAKRLVDAASFST